MFDQLSQEKNRDSFSDAHEFDQQCLARQEQGFNSGRPLIHGPGVKNLVRIPRGSS